MTGPNRIEVVIEGLKGRIHQLEEELSNAQNMICLMTHKFGNPVILTRRDMEGIPDKGVLAVSTDPDTQAIMITFGEETT